LKAADTEETTVTGTDVVKTEDIAPETDTTTKTVEPDAEKATVSVSLDSQPLKQGFDSDVLVKAFTAAFSEEDSALRKMFVDIVEASAQATVVEQMATPGGPSLRRTETERNQARRTDLANEAARFKMLATVSEDPDLRKGYAAKALALETEVKALAA
jgi:hypothetical protein